MNATPNADNEKWTEKVAKLLAKAERASTPEEAEAFFSKAQDIMARLGIEEARVWAARKGTSADKIVSEDVDINRSGYFPMMLQLWREVAEANGVRHVGKLPKDWGKFSGVRLIGWQSDVEKVKLLATSLLLQCIRESKRDMPEYRRAQGATSMAEWRRSFRMAYAVRIGQRLREQIRLTQAEVAKETGNSDFLPALRDRSDAVNDFFEKAMSGNIKNSRRGRAKYAEDGYGAGHAAADRADLGNTRVGNGSRKSIQ